MNFNDENIVLKNITALINKIKDIIISIKAFNDPIKYNEEFYKDLRSHLIFIKSISKRKT